MAAVMRPQDPMVSLFESPIHHPDSSASFLSFSALADFEGSQRDEQPIHNTWPGAQNWQMGDAPAYQRMEALEAFELNDYYSLDSPQSCLAITPSEHSAQSYVTCDAGSIAPAQHRSSYPDLQEDTTYGRAIVGHDDQHVFSSGGHSTMSLNSKASHASFASSASGHSEYVLTPRHSIASNPYSWGSMSLPPGSPSQYPEQWTSFPVAKCGMPNSRSSIWSTESAGQAFPLTDYVNFQGETEENTLYFENSPIQPLSCRGSLSSIRRQSGSLPPVSSRDLSATFSNTVLEIETRSESGIATPQQSLLPAASIVGNVQGWQSSSPTYPSLLDYEDAATSGNFSAHGHFGEPIAYPIVPRSAKAGPSGLGAAYLSVPRGAVARRSRSSDSVARPMPARPKTLFAFHPVAESPYRGGSPYDPIDAAAQQYPSQVISSGLSSRRNLHGLEVQIPLTPEAGAYGMPAASRARSQSSRMHTPVAVTPPPPSVYDSPGYSPYCAPLSAPPMPQYAYHHAAAISPSPAGPSLQPSVLASAPGGIQIAPPLSMVNSGLALPPGSIETTRPRVTSISNRAASSTVLTSEPLCMPELKEEVCLSADTEVRPIAKLPASRKASNSKLRKPSTSKRKISETGVSFGDFINYTPKDAAVISAGVAPSGSKAKRRSEDEGDQCNKRVRSSESA